MDRRKFAKSCLLSVPTFLGMDALSADKTEAGLKKIPKTDTHVHLFDLENLSYGWLKNAPEINRTFTLADFYAASKGSNVEKILFMESGTDPGFAVKEAEWVAGLADKHPRIKGIIAKLNLGNGKQTAQQLSSLEGIQLVKGVRGAFIENAPNVAKFLTDLKLLADRGLTFDLLLNTSKLNAAATTAKKCPNNVFILDHFGNPDIKSGEMDHWKKGIKQLAALPNVHCKMSGIITRVGKDWTLEQIKPYVLYVIEQFGTDRLIYGGDWPVVLRADSYRSWSKAFEKLTKGFSKNELNKIYHKNADRIYHL